MLFLKETFARCSVPELTHPAPQLCKIETDRFFSWSQRPPLVLFVGAVPSARASLLGSPPSSFQELLRGNLLSEAPLVFLAE